MKEYKSIYEENEYIIDLIDLEEKINKIKEVDNTLLNNVMLQQSMVIDSGENKSSLPGGSFKPLLLALEINEKKVIKEELKYQKKMLKKKDVVQLYKDTERSFSLLTKWEEENNNSLKQLSELYECGSLSTQCLLDYYKIIIDKLASLIKISDAQLSMIHDLQLENQNNMLM